MIAPTIVCIPAWNGEFIDTAVNYVIPAVRAALDGRDARFDIYTDNRERFAESLAGYHVDYYPVPQASRAHFSLTAAHRQTLVKAPMGATILMLNADIMVSREAFDVAEQLLAGEVRVVASVGIRALIADEPPPVGATASDLFAWSWKYKHPIVADLIWGRGRSRLTSMLFFEEAGSVVCHCFHLHPFFIKKDRDLAFKGTIDDDLLVRYLPQEVHVASNIEIGFAELSPLSKTHGSSGPMTVNSVVQLARRYSKTHFRNFGHTIRIVGDGAVNDDPAKQILRMLQR